MGKHRKKGPASSRFINIKQCLQSEYGQNVQLSVHFCLLNYSFPLIVKCLQGCRQVEV